jgi:hypothetical protein
VLEEGVSIPSSVRFIGLLLSVFGGRPPDMPERPVS